MMEQYICVHGHFYQPPRENPWLETIELQDSAHPYHDWNERITAECYAPNTASRILGSEGRIRGIVSNYARISFNIGPTLMAWLEKNTPEVYQAIIQADRQSIEWRSGHGNALAQVYNHMIMPLANRRDKQTQVIWGIRDFVSRFGRNPEGMWLAETAVDLETLEVLVEQGIRFTILAPRQAAKVRKIATGKWKDVSGGRIDPTRAYLCRLPSGRIITLFFYDGPISQAVAFEGLLKQGEVFAERLVSGFSENRSWPQLLHIATDGESYGHHHKFGDMALTSAIMHLETNGLARLTNYGEFLEKHPPTHEVQIFENSSWSCVHGIERWRSNCGCSSGGYPQWNQEWRSPLRSALDWLRDQLAARYEARASEYLIAPWQSRDDYVALLLNRSADTMEVFFDGHARRPLKKEERVTVLKLLEIQRHAMLMYTSCGWFFDEMSGIETVQILQYAGRAIQLALDVFGDDLEPVFLARLALAKSNVPEYENGMVIYDRFVKPGIIDLKMVAAHYAVSSIFEEYTEHTTIFSYIVQREDARAVRAGDTRLCIGRIRVSSKITGEHEQISYAVLYLGSHALNGGVRTFLGDEPYQQMCTDITGAFEKGSIAEVIHLMDTHFGMHNYSLVHLFRDEQRKIMNLLMNSTLNEFLEIYRKLYENNRVLMGFLHDEARMPIPKTFLSAAEIAINDEIGRALMGEEIDIEHFRDLLSEMKRWDVFLYHENIEFIARRRLEALIDRVRNTTDDLEPLVLLQRLLELVRLLGVEINFWHVQNVYYALVADLYQKKAESARNGDDQAAQWVAAFSYIGEMLYFDASILVHSA